MSQQFGTRLTREQAMALGIDQQVLAQLVSGAVLDEQARKLGLGVSKDRIARARRATSRPSRDPTASSTGSSSSTRCGRSA